MGENLHVWLDLLETIRSLCSHACYNYFITFDLKFLSGALWIFSLAFSLA